MGGFVYRGTAIPEIFDQYFYSDYCSRSPFPVPLSLPHLPLRIWLALGAAAYVLIAIAAADPLGVLRAPVTRARARPLSGRAVLLLCLLAVVPWVAVYQLPLRIDVNIHSTWLLVLWLLAALGVFTLLVPLPLAALSAALAWSLAQRARHRRSAESVPSRS